MIIPLKIHNIRGAGHGFYLSGNAARPRAVEEDSLPRKKKGRRLAAAAGLLLLLGLICFAVLEALIIGAARSDKDPEADWLIVLGAGLYGTSPSLTLRERLDAALDYLETYPDSVAVVSGGQGKDELISEALAMKNWLESRGIGSERIVTEDRSKNTAENIAFSLELIRGLGGTPENGVAIATSEYHIFRAKLIAESHGIRSFGVAGLTSHPALKIRYFIREAFGAAHFTVFGA
ncbi:MAG: YdcF family protein [Oscillospiraceae bacterium]|nr:YdcF family protein [Oscillospiraceae bacterium]